jgi:two-component system NarL family sensor kinase
VSTRTQHSSPGRALGLALADVEQENALLLGIIDAASTGPAIEPLAAAVAELITQATATDVCFVHLLDDAERSLTLVGATPPFDEQVGRVRLPVGTGVTGWVAQHGVPTVIVEGKESDARYVPIRALRGTDFTSMASVPMACDPAGLVGVLNVHTVLRRAFSDRDIRLLVAIGRLVAGALHQARMHRRLAARERAHERFAEQVIVAQETERRRVAGDIHDGISQRLVTLSYYLDAVGRSLTAAPEVATEHLDRARELVDVTLDEARAAISGLRPPVLDDLGLAGGLRSLARSLPEVEARLDVADERLPDHLEIALYRIAQEGLQNVLKHAAATAVDLVFAVTDGTAELRVADDGRGFDPGEEGSGYGLRSMAERIELVGGTLQVVSRPAEGTTVTVRVPLSPQVRGGERCPH